MDLRAITDLAGGRLKSGKLFGPVGPADFPPTISSRTGNPLPIGCGSTLSRLSPVRPPTRTPGGPLPMRFSSTFTPLFRAFPPNTAASDAQQRNADQHHVSSTDADRPNDPWDPGVPVAQRRSHASVAPAPQTAPADGRSRHKDRLEEMYHVPRGKRSDAGRHVRTSDEDADDASSDPHATRVSHASGAHTAPRDMHIAAHPVRRGPLFAALGHFLILQFSTKIACVLLFVHASCPGLPRQLRPRPWHGRQHYQYSHTDGPSTCTARI